VLLRELGAFVVLAVFCGGVGVIAVQVRGEGGGHGGLLEAGGVGGRLGAELCEIEV